MAKPSTGGSYKRKNTFNLKGEWKGFTVCLLLAFFLWVLTSLNETYNSRLEVNVRYINQPRNLVFSNQLPPTLRVNVNARGWDLLGYYIRGGSGNVLVNLEDYRNFNYLPTNRLRGTLQAQIADKVIIHDIFPDTISLRKERQYSSKVPVKLNMSLSFAEQHGISGDIEFFPDSVTVTGSREIIPKIKYVETLPVQLNKLSNTTSTVAEIKKSATQNIHYSADRIRITIPMDKLTEKIAEVPIQIVNQKFISNVRLIPQRVSINFLTTLTKYHSIDENLFEVVVDGQEMDTVLQKPLRVQLISYPKFIYKPRLSQEYVDYIITR